MEERKFLSEEQDLLLTGIAGEACFLRRFHIRRVISQGGSAICYEARHDGSGWGVLKEFYPRSTQCLIRREDGQLLFTGEEAARSAFQEEQRKYLEAFRLLLSAKQEGRSDDLQTFIPAFEIYHGQGDAQAVYVWTEQRKSETFADLCCDIQKAPDENPEENLVTVLGALSSLCKCLCTLHSLGLIHRDIKPDNFGFASLGQEIQTQSISLFDINTVCAIYPRPRDYVYSPGFSEPWEEDYTAGCRTDLYSIGACLFHALAITDETESSGYCYREEYFPRLGKLISQSHLLTSLDDATQGKLPAILTKILQSCLGPRKDRYENCEALLADLKQALAYAQLILLTAESQNGDHWVRQEARAFQKLKKEEQTALALRCHLFRHPMNLICDITQENTIYDLDVAVLGLGQYSRQFLDICLMIGQIPNHRLHVTVLSNRHQDWEEYLAQRPSLGDFFLLGSHEGYSDEHYGSIVFRQAELSQDAAHNEAVLADTIWDLAGTPHQPQFVFAALGNSEVNLAAAMACRNAARSLEIAYGIHFVWEKFRLPQNLPEDVIPVRITADITQSPTYTQMERMAFNVHLTWKKSLNQKMSLIREEYREPYNHHSSIDYVLSLQAKLRSLGIDLQAVDPLTAAEMFCEQKLSAELRSALICAEHRRWVTEKLTLGWVPIHNLSECLSPKVKRGKNMGDKRHVCLVPSTPVLALSAREWTHDQWDTASPLQLKQLDPLDRMSVQLHQLYRKEAERLRSRNFPSFSALADLPELLDKNNLPAQAAFQEWFACVKEICNGDAAQYRRYESLFNALPQPIQSKLQKDGFPLAFRPILESVAYRDYKQDNTALIDNIPFILTYTEALYLAVPFSCGSNSQIFSNLAAAMVANPAKILLLYYVDTAEKLRLLRDALPQLVSFMKKKNLRAKLELICACHNCQERRFSEKLKQELEGSCRGGVRFFLVHSADASVDGFRKFLEKRSASASGQRLLALEGNDSPISYLLQGAGLYQKFPNYRFNPVNLRFSQISGCQYLTYIRKKPCISVSDMVSLSCSFSLSSDNPAFHQHYKRYWDKYSQNSKDWKKLCECLGRHAVEQDHVVTFELSSCRDASPCTRRVNAKYALLNRLFRALAETGVLAPDYWLQELSDGSCQVTFTACTQEKAAFDKLFAQCGTMIHPDLLSVYKKPKKKDVCVTYSHTQVRDFRFPGTGSSEQNLRMQKLLAYFNAEGDIYDLQSAGNAYSFSYASPQIKELLTVAGKVLEIYTYHQSKAEPFDDVVSGYEILWAGTNVKSEFDCILTKGLCSLVVECKAQNAIEQDFYFKLSCLEQQFGINSKAVLIADTQERPYWDNSINKMQRARGNMLDIITISDAREIENIGQTLHAILNGTYSAKTNP